MRSGHLYYAMACHNGLVLYPKPAVTFYQHLFVVPNPVLLTDHALTFANELAIIQQPNFLLKMARRGLHRMEFCISGAFPADQRDVWLMDELLNMDINTVRAWAKIAWEISQPFAQKALLFNYNISFLDSYFERICLFRLKAWPFACCICIKRVKRQIGASQIGFFSRSLHIKTSMIRTQVCGQTPLHHQAVDTVWECRWEQKIGVQYEDFALIQMCF